MGWGGQRPPAAFVQAERTVADRGVHTFVREDHGFASRVTHGESGDGVSGALFMKVGSAFTEPGVGYQRYLVLP